MVFARRFPIAFVFLLVGVLRAQNITLPFEPSPVLRIVSDQGARILAPGSTVQLSVQAIDPSGSPLAGRTIRFVVPDAQPVGLFPDSEFDSKTIIDVDTGADGTATATFQAGASEALVPVDAALQESVAGATFAISILENPAAGFAEAQILRESIRSELLGGRGESNSERLHGPYLLPAGAVLNSAGPHPLLDFRLPRQTSGETWIAWIDDHVDQLFAHEVRFVISFPGEDVSEAEVLERNWWPEVVLPSSDTLFSLAPAAGQSRLLSALDGGSVITPALKQEPSRKSQAPADACAILFHGPNIPNAARDVGQYVNFLVGSQLVQPGNVILTGRQVQTPNGPAFAPQPVTRAAFQQMIQLAAQKGCKKIYIYWTTHGLPSGLQFAGSTFGTDEIVSYRDLRRDLEPLKDQNLCIFNQACFSGNSIPFFGSLNGKIITAADGANTATYFTQFGGALWVYAQFAITMSNGAADLDRDGTTTLEEAVEWAKANVTDPRLQMAMPQTDDLLKTFNGLSVPDVLISSPGESRLLTIDRPFSIPNDQAFELDVEIEGGGIAGATARTVRFAAGASTASVDLRGFNCGVTNVRLSGMVGGREYRGRGRVQVGAFRITPNPATAGIGVGQEAAVTVNRLNSQGTFRVFVKVRDPSVAVGLEPNGTENPMFTTAFGPVTGLNSLRFRGRKVGTTLVDLLDVTSGLIIKTIRVDVRANATPTACPSDALIRIRRATGGPLGYPVPPPSGTCMFQRMGGNFYLRDCTSPSMLPVMGAIDEQTCQFSGSGEGPLGAAGGMRTNAELTGGRFFDSAATEEFVTREGSKVLRVNAPNDSVEFTYKLSTNGTLPTGQPTTFEMEAGVESQSGDGCEYSLSGNVSFSAAGGEGFLAVDTAPDCPWTAASDVDWVHFGGDATQVGSATVRFFVGSNVGGPVRTTSVTAGGEALTLTQGAIPAQGPFITAAGVVSGASFETGAAGAGWISILGVNFTETTRTWGDADFNGDQLPTSLEGVRAFINGRPAYVFFISPGQLNVLGPDDELFGDVEVYVETPAGTSNTVVVQRRPSAPALFVFTTVDGASFPAVVHADGVLAGKPDLLAGAAFRAVGAGDALLFFGTGFGPTAPPTPTDRLVPGAVALGSSVVVRIGGRYARVLFAGLVGSGLYQVNIIAPDLPPGDHPVEIFVDGVPVQDRLFLTFGE